MANQKNSSKKKSTSTKSTSNKTKTVKEETSVSKNTTKENLKKIESLEGSSTDTLHIVRVVAIIVIIFSAFYFLTLYLTNRESSSSNTTTSETTISYSNIIAGRSFSMPEEEYLVLYYDSEDTDLISSLNTASNSYLSKDDHMVLYYVDMADAFNQKYANSSSNSSAANASELSINGPTLIHFAGGSITEYIEGEEAIVNYFE